MVGEWRETTLGEVTDFLSGGTPSKDQPNYWGGSIPWVSAKDMKRFRLEDTEDHVTELGVANGTKLVPAGTVLLLARGMTLLNDLPICIANCPMTFNQDVKALRPKLGVRNDFLPYVLLGNKDRLLNLVDLAGHGTGRLNSDELKSLNVVLPPEPEQRAIAHILGTLDDKIELNRRMNETLEAMARAIFKSWFVDFDPVRAKAEGRLPASRQAAPPPPKPGAWFVYALECENGSVYVGHAEDVQRRFDEHARGKGAEWTKRHPPRRIAYWEDLSTRAAAAARERKLKTGSGRKWLKQEIARRDLSNGGLPQPLADLFPARFEDSELGEIPEGWRVLRVGEALTTMGGGTPSTKEPRFWDGGEYNWATPKDMSNLAAPILLDTERKITEDGLAQISSGLLPVGTVLLSSRAPVGYLALAATPLAVNQGFIAMRCDGPVSNHYALNWCHFRMGEIEQRASGTTFAEISKAAFRPIPMIVPGTGVMQYFTDRVEPLYKAIEERLREIRTLTALRDTLLPRLISGELRVGDGERLVGRGPTTLTEVPA